MRSDARFSIRARLLLLSVTLLLMPLAGIEYVRELERYLRDSFALSLADAARAVAGSLHDQAQWFAAGIGARENTLYVHRLAHPIQLDGYTDDWLSYIDWSDNHAAPQPAAEDAPGFRLILGRFETNVYGLLQVRDRQLVYQRPEVPDALDNDHVVMSISDARGVVRDYNFSPAAPGSIRPFVLRQRFDEFGFAYPDTGYITNITGEFQPLADGYHLEFAIPGAVFGGQMGLVVHDVDDAAGRATNGVLGISGDDTRQSPSRIVEPSLQLLQTITRFAEVDGRRLWVLDQGGRVLASVGSLEKKLPAPRANPFYRLILPPVHETFRDDLAGSSRLQGEEVRQALTGGTSARWRASPDGRTTIVSAATPVFLDTAVGGAVVVEETTGGIQVLQRQAMISLFNKTFMVFIAVTLLVLAYATRLSLRLRRLATATDAAIDAQGRVTGELRAGSESDEIGELSRTFAAMLKRLQEYNRYLESLAGRLSHELRTPITIVRSSLEQLQSGAATGDAGAYLARAMDGAERLNLIVTRLAEAARLEQAMQQAHKEETDVVSLVGDCAQGYALAFGEVRCTVSPETAQLVYPLATDLFEQLLDKLFANAGDFRVPGTAIELMLLVADDHWLLRVSNQGPPLPESMRDNLFQSMVSVRARREEGTPHLGLGLYIARLITEFHGGRIDADNLPAGAGVSFSMRFPLSPGNAPVASAGC